MVNILRNIVYSIYRIYYRFCLFWSRLKTWLIVLMMA